MISHRPLLSVILGLMAFFLLSTSATAGDYFKREIMIGEELREYYVYVPNSLKGKKNRPAIIAFHGFKSDAGGFRWLISPDKWADKHGFVMVYPNAIKKSWNAGKGMGRQNTTSDDDRFAAELPSLIVERHDVAVDRVYAMGFSNGAQVVAKMVCHHSVQIAGAAMVAQSLNEDDCRPAYKVPVVIMHGMQDPAAPYKGGGKFKLRSHQESLAFFKDWYEIKAEKKTVKSDKTFKCSEYKDNDKTAVVGCSMFNDGHQWPGSRDFLVKQLGTTNKSLSANDYIMSFFKRYKGIAPYMGDATPATKPKAKQVAKKPAAKKPAPVKSTQAKPSPAKSAPAKPAPVKKTSNKPQKLNQNKHQRKRKRPNQSNQPKSRS
ncbi:alpha/beta hydrolase family esterase [Leucothrix pacifica]|uniref:Phospholipase/carboxylesterase/thioesterase domain-containing protein n=1 Tax=Leucothrix pacifica TaxID=1247513 RepID=A0A317C6V7_9GAMM|nr:PHB depolymerase family esterase [Leucothrix pacifica]PWQ94039.1 hypothetical protein DKW60_17530 [Leucothrix pacifica]